ncbi:hypothetical protein [Marinobacterium sp. MBR-109]|jgi:hypothetical protein|uniref:hypothetical protein n=1 Tax=Marinobacterium sp. MBR-109 TaxID=3156462 RepID=UPI0033970B75
MKRSNAEIDKIALFIETAGQAYAVTLPHDRLMILVQMASGLSDSGALPVQKLPEGFEFTTIGEVQSEHSKTGS